MNDDGIHIPHELDSVVAEHDEMSTSGHNGEQHDPWFPNAQAAEGFPEGQSIPEGQTYDEWKQGTLQ